MLAPFKNVGTFPFATAMAKAFIKDVLPTPASPVISRFDLVLRANIS